MRTYRPKDFPDNNGRIYGFSVPTLTHDARYLLSVSHSCINRFSVRGSNLIHQEQGNGAGSNTRTICMSNDSKYVALPSGGGNGKGYSTYVYSITNLKERVLEAKSGAYPQTIAFDKKAGFIYAQNHGVELITFTTRGLLNKEYDLVKGNGNVRKFLVHPSGHKILVLTHPKIVLVNLPQQ